MPRHITGQREVTAYILTFTQYSVLRSLLFPCKHTRFMLHGEGIVLKDRDESCMYEFDVSGAQCVAESAKGFSMAYKNKPCVEFQEDWQKLKSKGRVARETKDCVDGRGSGNFLQNPKLQNIHTKGCKLCPHPTENVSHVLHGCPRFRNAYQSRHNLIVDILSDKVRHFNGPPQAQAFL